MNQPRVVTQREVGDEVRQTTCYMCACRCGIDVHLKSGKVAYIEGNRDHPINKGVLCAKGASGIMQVTAPSRLKAPLRRVGPRGSGAFEEISWEQALETAVSWLKRKSMLPFEVKRFVTIFVHRLLLDEALPFIVSAAEPK